jgi:hypothetical protein
LICPYLGFSLVADKSILAVRADTKAILFSIGFLTFEKMKTCYLNQKKIWPEKKERADRSRPSLLVQALAVNHITENRELEENITRASVRVIKVSDQARTAVS